MYRTYNTAVPLDKNILATDHIVTSSNIQSRNYGYILHFFLINWIGLWSFMVSKNGYTGLVSSWFVGENVVYMSWEISSFTLFVSCMPTVPHTIFFAQHHLSSRQDCQFSEGQISHFSFQTRSARRIQQNWSKSGQLSKMTKKQTKPQQKSTRKFKTSSSSKTKQYKETRDEQQRIRNIDSAKRSRERLRFEEKWMQVQAMETADRIGRLEKQVSAIWSEVDPDRARNGSSSRSKGEEKPSWFGAEFWWRNIPIFCWSLVNLLVGQCLVVPSWYCINSLQQNSTRNS